MVIDVAGKTLMPGLIDAHAHITGLNLSPRNISYPPSEIALACSNYLRNSLMDGFTSIREAGGADHSIAQLLAKGTLVGPRLFYSGRALTQTGGGADFRTPGELIDPCGHVSPFSVMSVISAGGSFNNLRVFRAGIAGDRRRSRIARYLCHGSCLYRRRDMAVSQSRRP